jgi:hypothetical protein
MISFLKFGKKNKLLYFTKIDYIYFTFYSIKMSKSDTATLIKSKRIKKVIEEPESCPICISNYTPIIKKKCVCKYCKGESCSKCIERYLLDRHEDAHCLHCRVNYNDTTLREICTKTFLQNIYFKHRQEILVNRERANLPGLQDLALDERKKRERNNKINIIRKDIKVLENSRSKVLIEYNEKYEQYYKNILYRTDVTDIRKELDDLLALSNLYIEQIRDKNQEIYRIRWPDTPEIANGEEGDENVVIENDRKNKDERKKFIRRCTRNNCQGFLSTAWKCGICDYYSCSKCFVTKTQNQDDPHECKKEDLETAEMIKKDSKPCPNCGEFIMKSAGCFAKDTPILMWNGTIKMSQDIQIGDELIGDDGTKRTVLDTINGVDTLYEVKQTSGMTYVVNSKHTLVLKFSGEKNIYWSDKENKYKINWFDREGLCGKSHNIRVINNKTKEEAYKEIQEFRDMLKLSKDIEIKVDEFMKLTNSDKSNLLGFKSNGINWEKKEVLLDPYLMGVYLGDGINDGMSFAINADADPEILEYILKWTEEHDSEVVHDDMYRFRVRRRGNKQNIQKAIGRGASCETCNGCKKKLCKVCDNPEIGYNNNNNNENYIMSRKNKLLECIEYYGLLRNKKFIPNDYLINDRDTRIKVLAGIIDTDGHLSKEQEGKRILICSSIKEFAEQIVLLSRSLGFATTIRPVSKKGICFKKGGEKKDYNVHYQINISGNISEIPTLIKRKKCVNSTQNRLYNSIQVSEIGLGEYFGWKVNCNSKFVLTDLTCVNNCSQMFCISCQTPWDWNTGKVVTSGTIHNPHYYEWLKRNGGEMPRNPADVPCGGYPPGWQLHRMPLGIRKNIAAKFYEFHRMCMELQEISERSYRTHIDQTSINDINIKFLLGDFDEKHWGQLLGKNERKRKRDSEVQDIFAAFRMVAVELINRVQNYVSEDGRIRRITDLPVKEAEAFIENLDIEIQALLKMINEALYNVSISYNYSVPYIKNDERYYLIGTKNFSDEVKKKRGSKNSSETTDTTDDVENNNQIIDNDNDTDNDTDNDNDIDTDNDTDNNNTAIEPIRRRPQVAPAITAEIDSEDEEIQAAIVSSYEDILHKMP